MRAPRTAPSEELAVMKRKSSRNRPKALRDLKTALGARLRSKPSAEGQRFLDLYSLQRRRLRWSRMQRKAKQQVRSIDRAIAKLGFEPEFIESATGEPEG